ncbi:MAG: hypothetical protein AcusKO_03210 [Acuticoccus sp.]
MSGRALYAPGLPIVGDDLDPPRPFLRTSDHPDFENLQALKLGRRRGRRHAGRELAELGTMDFARRRLGEEETANGRTFVYRATPRSHLTVARPAAE